MSITTVEIDETHRLVLDYDQDLSGRSPRDDWEGHLTAFVDCQNEYGWSGRSVYPPTALYDDPTAKHGVGLPSAVSRLWGVGHRPGWSTPGPVTVERWARIFHGLAVEWDDEAHGFWVLSPDAWQQWMVVPESEDPPAPFPGLDDQRKRIAEERETYRQWADGEVYVVTAEVRIELFREGMVETDEGPRMGYVHDGYDWRFADNIGGIYRDDQSYTLPDDDGIRRVANDHFGTEFETPSLIVPTQG